MLQSLSRTQEAAIGIFDAILGNASSSATDNAAMWSNIALAQGQTEADRALNRNTGKANDALQDGFSKALSDLIAQYSGARSDMTSYAQQAQGALQTGTNRAADMALSSNAGYQPYADAGKGALSMYLDGLGLGGAAGHDAATAAFRTSPGYEWQQSQATDAAARKAASLGMAASGNTLDAITKLSSQLADNEYNSWMNNLQSVGTQGMQALGAISGNNQSAAGFYGQGGTNSAQMYQTTGQNLGTLGTGEGGALAGLHTGLGSGQSSNFMNLGQGLASTAMNTAQGFASVDMAQGKADDNVTSANNGIFSKLIGGITGLPFGGNSLSTPSTGGFTMTPGANGSFSFAPTAASGSAASSGGSGFFGPLLAGAGKSVAKGFGY